MRFADFNFRMSRSSFYPFDEAQKGPIYVVENRNVFVSIRRKKLNFSIMFKHDKGQTMNHLLLIHVLTYGIYYNGNARAMQSRFLYFTHKFNIYIYSLQDRYKE